MNKLQNKWALITGSSRGIGQQIAIGLAKEGCNIIVHGRKIDNTKHTIDLLSSFPIKTYAVSGELGNIAEENLFINNILNKIGHIDILYNNAAIANPWNDNIFKIQIADWNQVFETNFFAMVRICNVFVPLMIEHNWGRVINLTSGIKDVPQLAPYGASKAAVDKYTKDLAYHLKGTNILVNALDPGWLKTDMGGKNADFEVEAVLPGALVPALLTDNKESGILFKALDYKTLS